MKVGCNLIAHLNVVREVSAAGIGSKDLSMLFCIIFNKSWFYPLTLKSIWYLLDIQRSDSVKFHEVWM